MRDEHEYARAVDPFLPKEKKRKRMDVHCLIVEQFLLNHHNSEGITELPPSPISDLKPQFRVA